MRLLVVSHTPHYRDGERIVGWGPTVRELDRLSTLFDETVHVAPLHPGEPPAAALPYGESRIRYRAVPPSGGRTLGAKLGILRRVPTYLAAIRAELARADVVHLRCPANIALVALGLLLCRRRPSRRWIKYAGSWKSRSAEPLSYRLQRSILGSRLPRSLVTINGPAPAASHILSFPNPSYSESELGHARRRATEKRLTPPLRLLFCGRLEPGKGVEDALAVGRDLRASGIGVELDIAGAGSRSEAVELAVAEDGWVRLHGWLAPPDLGRLYAAAHCVLLPSETEGWPKVLSEAMAHGAVPAAYSAGAIEWVLSEAEAGIVVPVGDRRALADGLRRLLSEPDRWWEMQRRGLELARNFTYETYLEHVRQMARSHWDLELPPADRARSAGGETA